MPVNSFDDYEGDDIPLEDLQRAQREYDLDEKQARLVHYVKANLPVRGFAELLGQEFWLREVIKDLDSKIGTVRTAALRMLGEFYGCLGNKKSGGKPKAVEIIED